jgi:hypothetical protein
MKIIRHSTIVFIFAWGLTCAARAQVYSVNAVGYINSTFRAGDQLFGNQLANEDNNTLNVLFAPAAVPNGTTISLWNSQSGSYLPPSVFDLGSGWSINYSLEPGVGALMHAPSPFNDIFVGEVVGYDVIAEAAIPPTPPGDGTFLLACRVPFTSASFEQTIGRAPREGDSVTRLDNLTGTYFSTSFHGGDWDNGTPALRIMEAAFFNLGPASVPEPAVWVLGLAGSLSLLAMRRFGKADACKRPAPTRL